LPTAGYCTHCQPDALLSFQSISVVDDKLAWGIPFRIATCFAACSSTS
jgi:hypothetical protein